MDNQKTYIFRYHSTDSGHCRVYYTTRTKLGGPSLLYCLQQDTHTSVQLYRCSQDGEPSHEVQPSPLWVFHFPKVEDRDNPTKLETLVNQWIKNLEGGAK